MMCLYLSASAEAIAYIKQCLSMVMYKVRAADRPRHQGRQDATSPATVVQQKLNASTENCLIPPRFSERRALSWMWTVIGASTLELHLSKGPRPCLNTECSLLVGCVPKIGLRGPDR